MTEVMTQRLVPEDLWFYGQRMKSSQRRENDNEQDQKEKAEEDPSVEFPAEEGDMPGFNKAKVRLMEG